MLHLCWPTRRRPRTQKLWKDLGAAGRSLYQPMLALKVLEVRGRVVNYWVGRPGSIKINKGVVGIIASRCTFHTTMWPFKSHRGSLLPPFLYPEDVAKCSNRLINLITVDLQYNMILCSQNPPNEVPLPKVLLGLSPLSSRRGSRESLPSIFHILYSHIYIYILYHIYIYIILYI